MEKISLFNYEAYYLDYLEGTLNEEDTALLLDFLEKHPECQVDESIMDTTLDVENATFSLKQDLKETDDNEAITLENKDHFMAAYTEGQLSESKEKELFGFVEANSLEDDLKIAELVYFEPDMSHVYQHKESLKQDRTIVLWPYIASIAGVAAAFIIAFLLFWNPGIDVVSNQPSGVAEEESTNVNNNADQVVDDNQAPIPVENSNDNIYNAVYDQVSEPNSNTPRELPQERKGVVSDMQRNPVRPIVAGFNNKELASVTKRSYTEEETNTQPVSEDYASMHFADMSNPIKPITKFVADKTNTDIDFRSRKKSKKKAGGFYIKVGKFEVSRKKH
jgi:hypothetical protein